MGSSEGTPRAAFLPLRKVGTEATTRAYVPELSAEARRALAGILWRQELLSLEAIRLAAAKIEDLEREGVRKARGIACEAKRAARLKAMPLVALLAAVDVVERLALMDLGEMSKDEQLRAAGPRMQG